jgi:small subunit ribosomal protein S2
MALVDTNCDPDPIDYVIACNDDALKSIKLILQALMQAVIDRKNELNVGVAKGDAKESSEEEEFEFESKDKEESEGEEI